MNRPGDKHKSFLYDILAVTVCFGTGHYSIISEETNSTNQLQKSIAANMMLLKTAILKIELI